MEPIVSGVLAAIAKALISKLAGKIANDLYDRIKSDPAQKVLKKALGAAIKDYASRDLAGLVLAQPLMKENSPLILPDVVGELAKVVRFAEEPDLKIIGERWKEALFPRLQEQNFTKEAQILVEYLENELRGTEVFRPFFDAKSLDSVAASVEESADTLANIEEILEGYTSLLDARFGQLVDTFTRASDGIRDQIYDFTGYIEEKTRGFVGRQWVFDSVNHFIDRNSRGYFFIIGDPGIGKSALSAQMVKQNGYIHHFNIRAEGINKAATFLKNVSAQLIATYGLPYTALPSKTAEDASVLNKLLREVSDKLKLGELCIIAVDALDEAERTEEGGNLLYLPLTLPERVYIVVTMRDDSMIKPRVDCEQDELKIEHDSSDNLADVADFVKAMTVRPGIQEYIMAQDIQTQEFVTLVVDKSEGNFMYLRHVLPEIERGAYKDLKLEAIPKGLRSYYEDHWRRMKGRDEEAWFEYKLPVIVALTVVREAVSTDLLSNFSKVKSRSRIQAVLQEWWEFLHKEYVGHEGVMQRRYRLYHNSFFDFIADKEQVADERVDLQAMHGQIADALWRDMFDDEEFQQ